MDLPITAITQSIKRGDILLSDFDGIDHQKFFVVMGVSEDAICGFFFINSNNGAHIRRDKYYPQEKVL